MMLLFLVRFVKYIRDSSYGVTTNTSLFVKVYLYSAKQYKAVNAAVNRCSTENSFGQLYLSDNAEIRTVSVASAYKNASDYE